MATVWRWRLLIELFEPFSAVFDRLIEVNFSGEGRTTLKNSGRAAPRLTNVLGAGGEGNFKIHLRVAQSPIHVFPTTPAEHSTGVAKLVQPPRPQSQAALTAAYSWLRLQRFPPCCW